jgi:uncharacterized protein (TIGR02270 family)
MIHDIVSQHAEEAAFLWLLRDGAVCAPQYLLTDLARLDERLEAHLDGLRVAGGEGWEISQQELKWQEPGEVFAAAVLALESEARDRIEFVVDVGAAAPALERGLVSALGWTAAACVAPLVSDLSHSAEPARRRLAIAAHAIRREDPGRWLIDALRDEDLGVRARAYRAAGELGKSDLAPHVRHGLAEEGADCRYWAAWAAARLGDRSTGVARALQDIADQPGAHQEQAVAVLARIRPLGEIRDWLRPLWKDVKTLRLAAAGIAAAGDPQFVPVLLQIMHVNEAARAAGEAFSFITGVHLSYDKLERDAPIDFSAGPTEDAEDENVAMDPDENLEWPDPGLVEAWWGANSARFAAGRRYLCGREISPASLVQTLHDGYQRQRAAAALELAMLEPARPMFEIRARADWQRKLLPVWFPQR